MGKSSLGKRKTSLCPVRLSSLGEVPERSARQSRSSVKTSFIPRPSRNRTQSSSPAKDAPKFVSTASVRRSRSNSNLQHIGTPMTPMCWLGSIPGTAQSSRGRGRPAKPILKDPRPLSDKQFQNAAVQKVQNYLIQMDEKEFMQSASNALSKRSLTLKMFVDLMSRLLSHFFPKHIINMSNYADEIPLVTKKLGYPGSVKKSWLITANSTHSWPNVVGLFSWLVDVIRSVRYEKLMKMMFGYEDDEEMPENFLGSKRMLSYYLKCYELFNKGESTAVEDSQLYHEMEKKCNISDKDIMSLTEELEKLKIQLQAAVEEREAVDAEMLEQKRIVSSFQNDLKKLEDSVQKKYTYRDELQDCIDKRSSKVTGLSEHFKNVQADILRMKHTVDNQTFTLEDKKRIETECRELEESIHMDRACCDTYLKAVYADDLQIAKMTNESKSRNVAYSASIVECSHVLPDLNILNMPVNVLHRDADQTMQDILNQMDSIRTELKTKLNEMETQLEENEKLKRNADECKFVATEEYNNTARMVEDLETEIANMKEKMKHDKQQLKDNLKRVEDGCARHAQISLSLHEEEHKLKEYEEACQSVKAHMLDVDGQIKLLFAEMDAMYADLLQKMKDSTNSLDLGPEE